MKKFKNVRKIMIAALILVLAFGTVGEAAEFVTTPSGTVQIASESAGARTVYLQMGRITFSESTGKVGIVVTTGAFSEAPHIYHDVTIYKNGSLYSSGRYEDWNEISLKTSLYVSASSGDYIDVYVDHYASDGSITETFQSNENYTY